MPAGGAPSVLILPVLASLHPDRSEAGTVMWRTNVRKLSYAAFPVVGALGFGIGLALSKMYEIFEMRRDRHG
jgi:hypothetical protein